MSAFNLLASTLAVTLAALQGAEQAKEKPLDSDRPDFTTGTTVVGRGRYQLEAGGTYTRLLAGNSVTDLGEVELRFGVDDRSEVDVVLPNYNWARGSDEEQGFDNTFVGAKIVLGTIQGTDFAFVPGVFIPTGSPFFRTDTSFPNAVLAWSHDLPHDFGISGSFAAAWPKVDDSRVTQYTNTISLGIPVSENCDAFLEHFTQFESGVQPIQLLHAGFGFRTSRNTRWDIHYAIGLNKNSPVYLIGAGYSVRF